MLALGVGASSPTVAAFAADELGRRDPAEGASMRDLPSDAAVLHVDGAGYDRERVPDGSEELPFPTITWAVAHGQQLREDGQAVHILVSPGTYRERVNIDSAGDDPPLVLEAEVPGQTFVSGADVEERLTPVPDTNRVTAPWTHDWGLAHVPSTWEGVDIPNGVRRREAVIVDGSPLRQVLAESDLEAGTFLVNEEDDQLIIEPPAEIADLEDHVVEVAQRRRVLHIRQQAGNVTVKGFVFESAAAGFENHMAYVSDATDVLIEGNTFRHSSWGGLGVCCTEGITVRGNHALDNGGNGIDTFRAHDLVFEDNTIRGNNVRGVRNGYIGWSVAGSKHLLLHGAVFRDNVYFANWSRGLWFDTDVKNVLVDGDRSCANLRDGVFIEAVQGPMLIEDSRFCDNIRGGVIVATSGNVEIRRSTVEDNGYGQLVFTGDRNRSWTDHVTGESIQMGDFENWTLTGNAFESNGAVPLVYSPVIPMDEWVDRLDAGQIVARDNAWVRPSLDAAIRVLGSTFPMDFWEELTSPADERGSDSGDTTPPTVTLTSGPTETVTTDTVQFEFTADEEGSTFRCRLVEGTWRPCSSPAAFDDLPDGEHTVVVQASDPAGNTGHTSRTFTVAAAGGAGTCEEDPSATHAFSDVPASHPFCSEIAWMAQAGIANGYDDETFRPNTDVTRQAMSAFMARLAGADPERCSSKPFFDVPTSHPFCSEIAWMARAGISNGYPEEGTFRPNTDVTRQAMAAFLARLDQLP